MKIKSEKEIIKLIDTDEWMMDILKAVKTLQLNDWWVCAGFVRSKIWDAIYDIQKRTRLDDIDVIYYDPSNIDEAVEKNYEAKLTNLMPTIPWSVKNEARMHLNNNIPPYQSSVDAISKFPETATALGVKLNERDEVILTAPCGIEDVLNGIIKPSPYFIDHGGSIDIFETRIHKKNWKERWNKLKIVELYKK